MQLSLEQIVAVKNVLVKTNDIHPNGNPVLRTFSNEDFSAYRWFIKNTDPLAKTHDELVKVKKAKLEKKYKEGKELQKKAIKNLTRLFADLEPGDEKVIIDDVKEIMKVENFDTRIGKEQNNDKDLIESFTKVHEVEMSDKTKDLLKRTFAGHQFNVNDISIGDFMDALYEEKEEKPKEIPNEGEEAKK